MIDKNRIIPVATLLLIGMLVTGPLVGFTDGQILTEKTYYEEDFGEYNESAVQLVADDELQSQHLVDTANWTTQNNGGRNEGPDYGSQSTHRFASHIDSRQPWLANEFRSSYDDRRRFVAYRTLDVPDDMMNPVLVVEHATYKQNNEHESIAIEDRHSGEDDGKILTTRSYGSSTGYQLERVLPNAQESNFTKVGYLDRNQQRGWTTNMFEVDSSSQNVTIYKSTTAYDNNGRDWSSLDFRNMYWVEGSDDTHQTSIQGYESVPEDDSFGGSDPYPLIVANEPTVEGEVTSIRSRGSEITREFTLDGISTKPQKVYFELDAESHSTQPINWRIEQYGQDVASGSISAGSSAQDTAELSLNDDTFTLYVNSGDNYEIKDVTVTALEETSAGDPLASEGPIVLDAQSGYDNTIGMFIDALDITTTTLLYIVMIALIVGAMAFSYTKSVRGQEFGQSMMYGAIITGVVMVGLVPTMNAATWIFTGGTDRAPLANPALEAEPPTYYSTEFQAGTMDGWEDTKGMARPVSSGEGFNLDMTADGEAAVIQRQVHISLGNSLDTGFVRMGATASSTPGYTSNPHETSVRARIYVTDGSEPNWETDYQNPLTESEIESNEDLVVAQEWARSFDGQVVNEEGTISFPMEGNTIYVELVAYDNRNDELASGSLNWIAVGATTEGTGEAVH
jgi:hypothetical protein